MNRLIFATHNPGKILEMRQMLEGLPIEVLSADEAGVMEDVVEDGETFAENALKKVSWESLSEIERIPSRTIKDP